MKTLVSTIATLMTLAAGVSAQTLPLLSTYHQSVNIGISQRSFAGLSFSYTRCLPEVYWGLAGYLHSGVEIPVILTVASRELDDFNLFAESGAYVLAPHRLGAGYALRLLLDRQTDVLGSRTALGVQVKATPSLRLTDTFIIGLDFTWHQILSMYVQHSAYTATTFTDRSPGATGPRDGWYALPATHFKAGLACGWIIRQRITTDCSTGIIAIPNPFGIFFDGTMFGQIPFYASIGIGFLF